MNKNIFRTDFTQYEIREALLNYVSLKKKNEFDEIFRSETEINDKKNICWYCKRQISNSFSKDGIYGVFCSMLCCDIFSGNIWLMFNRVDKINVNLPPLEIIKNKYDIYKLIDKTRCYSSFIGVFYYKASEKKYFFKLKCFENYNLKETYVEKIKLNDNNKICLSCGEEIVEAYSIFINSKCINCCSLVCKGSFLKLIERYFNLYESINLYLPPIIFFRDPACLKLIKEIKNDYIFGGLKEITDNTIIVSILTKF